MGANRYFTGELNEFELFCAYHLGLRSDGTYKPHKLSDIARRFKTNDASIEAALRDYKIDKATVRASGFDMSLAKLDVELAPVGIDRVEVARSIFQEFLDAGCGIGPVPIRNDLSANDGARRSEPDAE